jgi:hypothetical protein
LADAERLIQQQDYAGALKLLAAIQRDNPDLRDATSRLIAQIMTVTQHYNSVLEELNHASAAGDVAAMQKVLPELQKIDPQRAAGLSKTAGVLVGVLQLMNTAESLLAAGKAPEALALYLLPLADPKKAGFTLPVQEFEAAGYGTIITANVNRGVANILAAAGQEKNAEASLAAIPAKLKALLAGIATAETMQAFDGIVSPLLQAAAAEGAVRATAASLADVSRSLRDPTAKGREDPYLQYLGWLCLGREKKAEGIALALQSLWEKTALAASTAALASASAVFDAARSRYRAGAFAAADAGFDDAHYHGMLAVKAAALASAALKTSSASGWAFSSMDAQTLASLLAAASQAQETIAEASAYRLLITYRKDLDALPVAAPDAVIVAARASAETAELAAARAAIDTRAGEALAQRQDWDSRAATREKKAAAGAAPAELAQSARAMALLFTGFADTDLQQRDLSYALRIATIGGSDFSKRLQDAIAARKKAEDLKDGTKEGQAVSAAAPPEKHPEQAIPVFQAVSASLDALISEVSTHVRKLQMDKPYVTASVGLAVLLNGSATTPGYNDILKNAEAERANLDLLAAMAQRQIDDAAIASRQGDNYYVQALAEYTKNDTTGASGFLDNARAAYIQSLANAYTDHAATIADKDLNDLDNKILNLNKQIAVNTAQAAIVAINKKVSEKDFLGASDDLDSAERAWNDTGYDPYQPFETLRQTIQNALDLSQGREISRLDPKAAVVVAFLNNAQANLAASKLIDAMKNVNNALSVAPNYGTAKVLKLMIQKQTDPVGFQTNAAAQINTYMKMAASSSTTDQKTAYLALLDYSKLDPKFAAQLKGTIQELEYQLGVARRPATQQQIAQSSALVQEASALAQQGTQEAYQQALDRLKQAYQINPDNTAAVRLDAQVRAKMGSTALAALSATDVQVYNQAYSEYLSGAYQDAYDKVNALWKSARNQTYAPLQKLKKRCEVALNIS